MMKPGLQLALGQHLAMTPQLRQAIRLLQFSAVELKGEIDAALETNMMLEAAEDPAWADCGIPDAPPGRAAVQIDDGFSETTAPGLASAGRAHAPLDGADREPEAADDAPLKTHLMWQIDMGPLSATDRLIAAVLIDALDDDGYLTEPLEMIRVSLKPELDVEVDEVEAVLHRLQHLEPIGVGARDLAECLGLQLNALDAATPARAIARNLVQTSLAELARGNISEIARRLDIDFGSASEAVALVRSLNPRPGGALGRPAADFVVPDVVVAHEDGRWSVTPNAAVAPNLRVNGYYAGLLDSTPALKGNVLLRENLAEARWLIRSLGMRQETLLKVAAALVERQLDYLRYGEARMRPLILKDIADAIGMHESTVSRVTTNKFMQTPRGVVAFKALFSRELAGSGGESRSATATRALLKRLVAAEPASAPLSDGEIAERLGGEGIRLARRTVAKYREELGIPARNLRRRSALTPAGFHGASASAGA